MELKKAVLFPVAVVAIVCSGIVAAMLFRSAEALKPRTVLLKWEPPAPKAGVTVASYQIYRSQGNGEFGILALDVPVPSYVDTKVTNGNTYNYYVVAVDTKGDVSPPSNRATVTIP
jgi:fibronectin type 3 domain-containing protein